MYHDEDRTTRRGRIVGPREAVERLDGLDIDTWEAADRVFDVRVTRHWFDAIERPDDPLGRQALPTRDELEPHVTDVPDPVGERRRSPVPWVVRKHDDRALLLVTRRCHLYCRYCFRRDQEGPEDPPEAQLDAAIEYLRTAGLEEVILSGGDPLALPNGRLLAIIDRLRPEVPLVRIHTRAPITAPHRVTARLVKGLGERLPIWVVVHSNHPRELSEPVQRALRNLVGAGIPVLNQSVLLRGVNDDADVQVELCRALVRLGVTPYYLHHTDPVPGNAGFRVSIDQGLAIVEQMRRRLSGIALPRYVIDPPDGSGKVSVADYVQQRG